MGRLTVTGIVILLAVISINGQTTTASNATQQSNSGGHAEIIIRDSTRYSPAFLSGLRESISGASQPYTGMDRLEDNLLIVDTDTLGFPEDLLVNTPERETYPYSILQCQ
jgi:hypothetical protein